MNQNQARIEALELVLNLLSPYQNDGSVEEECCTNGFLDDERVLITQEYENIIGKLKKQQSDLLASATKGFPEED